MSADLARLLADLLNDTRAIADLSSESYAALLAHAEHHGVSGLLYHAIKKNPAWRVPPEIETELEQRFKHTHLTNYLANNTLLELLNEFHSANLDTRIIKGAALASWVYDDLGLRPYTDLDLLIRANELAPIQKILAAQNYLPAPTIVTGFADNAGQMTFYKKAAPPARIDLHWHLFVYEYYCQRIPIEWFWQHTIEITLNDTRVQTLDPFAQLLHLTCHSVLNHRYERLIWSCDIARLIEKYGDSLDWDALVQTAQEFGIAPAVRAGLERAVYWWRVPLPLRVLETLSHTRGDFKSQLVYRLATAPHSEARVLLDGISPSGIKNKFTFWLRHLFPPRAYMYKRYALQNNVQLLWHYPRRVGIVAFKFLRSLASTARNRIS